MSNRLNNPTGRQPGLPPEISAGGWTTYDYMLAAGLAWSLMVTSPILMATPFWLSGLMSPRN
jgi:hypothetical protein